MSAEDYELLSSFSLQGIIPFKKYRSKKTGILVYVGKVGGPLVNATEAHDDDGLPHTLEHLVFMGSEIYPFKGMLDMFANRCLAQGTNAWTDTDHTCYTMMTAGSEGFLNLMPIYLDHILYPTLTPSGYLTEVHHVNGQGEDAGVVYCEMQARENTGGSRTHLEFLRAMYPGESGYSSETGGIMANIRDSCSHKKVNDYHRSFYRPDNLSITITGQIDENEIFKTLDTFEKKIIEKGELPSFDRPWMNPIPQLETDSSQSVKFPTEDESTGMVLIGYRGPSVGEHLKITALGIILKYLVDTSVAPLQKELVEIDDPLCSDVDTSFIENLETCFYFKFCNVPKEKLNEVEPAYSKVIQSIVDGDEEFDLERLETLIHKEILEDMSALEDNPHEFLAFNSIGDFLYSDSHDKLEGYVDKISRLKKLMNKPVSYWREILKTSTLDMKQILVTGEPSEILSKQMTEEERNRIQKQCEKLGEKGLKGKADSLKDASEKNEVEPPPGLVDSLNVPSTDSIHFHDITIMSNRSKSKPQSKDLEFKVDEIPYAFQLNHIKSLFVEMTVIIDTEAIPREMLMYMPLFCEALFESPIRRNDVLIPYEQIVKELAADTLTNGASVGFNGGRFNPGAFSHCLALQLKMEIEKYEKGVQWLRDILFNICFTADRLKVIANKIVNDVASSKRSGRKVANALLREILFREDSSHHALNMVRQQEFLKQLIEKLDGENSSQILDDFNKLRLILAQPNLFRVFLAADATKLPKNSHTLWKDIFASTEEQKMETSTPALKTDNFWLRQNRLSSKLIGVGSVESAFLFLACPSITTYKDPDYAAMLVFSEYLTALEGPLWRQIRGLGLAYHYNISVSPIAGLLQFVLFKSSHVFAAFQKAKEIIEGYANGVTPFENGQIEAAISGTIFGIIAREQSLSSASSQSILAVFKDLTPEFNRELLKKVSSVTKEDLLRVGKKQFSNLFKPDHSRMAICCHPGKVEELEKSFKEIEMTLNVVTSIDEEFTIAKKSK